MSVAVAGKAVLRVPRRTRTPLTLIVKRTAGVAVGTASVVRTFAFRMLKQTDVTCFNYRVSHMVLAAQWELEQLTPNAGVSEQMAQS